MSDKPKTDIDETPTPDENAADSFFAMLEHNAEPSTASNDDIRVTPPQVLAHYYAADMPPSGERLDLTAEPPEQQRPENRRVVVLRTVPPKSDGLNWRMPLLLYIATWISVTLAGGFLFAVCIMTILTCHELGHYIQTLRYRVRSSLPYFIPLPIPGAIFGTMGAIIKMDGRIPNRRALFDIGISGPLAGLVPTLIFCVIGIRQAQVAPVIGHSLQFGDPLLLQWFSYLMFGPIPDEMTLYFNPVGMAGWFGLFLTSLNLFPIGQLDGGHVFYAILGKRAPALSVLLYTLIVAWVIFSQSYFWLFMLFLVYLMNPRHPPTQDDAPPIGLFRVLLGAATLAFIILGFSVNPISETMPDPYEQELLVRCMAIVWSLGSVWSLMNREQ